MLSNQRTPLLIEGMHGLGDNLHQRAILRQLMLRHEIWLESSWVAPYHDLIAAGLRVRYRPMSLRTSAKNALRETAQFSREPPPWNAKQLKVWYTHDQVRRDGSFLGAMAESCGCDPATADFRLPVPAAWRAKAALWIERWRPQKPLLIYRPLVERTEWGGCAARNPQHWAYAQLFRAIHEKFFVVSVADLVPGVEWIVGHPIAADATCHAGEIDFETLAALFAAARLVYCSPGFALVLAQAVGTPCVAVFGGHESSRCYRLGAKFAPFLGIDPVNPCNCFSHDHACPKEIAMEPALRALKGFVEENALAEHPTVAA